MSQPVAALVPHQPPMRWVDQVVRCDETSAAVTVCFDAEAYCVQDGRVLETALVECMAQAVAAAQGYRASLQAGGAASPVAGGMLAAVSDVRILDRPAAGRTLWIEVRELKRLGPMLLVAGEITCEGQRVASGELTLYA